MQHIIIKTVQSDLAGYKEATNSNYCIMKLK